jgi:KDO2-lipid IV(A) lauroyltransferase
MVVLSFFGRWLPLRTARSLGRILGRLGWHVVRRPRRDALRNVAVAFPEWTEHQRRDVIRRMFIHFGESFCEYVWLPNLDLAMRNRTTVIEGFEPIRALIEKGRGVVVFTAHCGNWEWLANSVGLLGVPVAVLQRERSEGGMNRLISDTRALAGVRTIDRGTAASGRELIKAIRRGGILAFLIDQNIRGEMARVPFFGRPTPTPVGPAKLAIRTEAIAVPTFIERRGDMQYIRFHDPIECHRGDDPVALTALITRYIEEQIRRVPEQWVWMHDRWKERREWSDEG